MCLRMGDILMQGKHRLGVLLLALVLREQPLLQPVWMQWRLMLPPERFLLAQLHQLLHQWQLLE